MAIKILLVDDHLVVRAGVSLVLKEHIKDLIISNAESFYQAIAVLKEHVFDLVILDINIPGGKNCEMISDIRAIQPDIKILVFSANEEELYATRYILSGANGYLNKLSSEEKIKFVVTTILETGKYIPSEIVNKIIEATLNKTPINPLDVLSKREFEIAQLLVSGYGNLEISNKLNIQMSTVSTYKNRVFEKLSLTNIVELIDLFKINIY
jgi:DNA-binding NarL/FixJ family response regulator